MRTTFLTLILYFAIVFAKLESKWVPYEYHKREYLGDKEVKVVLALSQQNTDLLEERFWAVSNPTNPEYGNHMNFQEVVEMVAPKQSTIDKVYSYLLENRIEKSKIELHQSRDFISALMSLNKAEELFQATYTTYYHKQTREVGVGIQDRKYKLHNKIAPHVDFISTFSSIKNVPAGFIVPEVKTARNTYSNIPATIAHGLDGSTNLLFFFGCPDGSGPSVSYDSNGNKKVSCGSIYVVSVNITVVSAVTQQAFPLSLPFSSLSFASCSNPAYHISCYPVSTYYNLAPDNAIGVAQFNYPNYSPFYVTVQLNFSDGTQSPVGQTLTVENGDYFTPETFSVLYGVPLSVSSTNPNNNQSVASFEGSSFSVADLQAFFEMVGLDDYSNLVEVVHPENNDQNNPSQEATLDIQVIMSNARNCKTYFWANNNTNTNVDDHLSWIIDVLNTPYPPLVHSVSYGNAETLDYTLNYVNRLNIEFMKAGARGLSIMYASGDNGAWNDEHPSETTFSPFFPASSPYVTAVGGTQIVSQSNDPSCYNTTTLAYNCGTEQVACSIAYGSSITTGGGFSNVFSRPSYQDAAVTGYLATLGSMTGFNASNRAYPDVSMNAHNVIVVLGGEPTPVDGTSASTPFFGALITLMNDIRLSAGNSPLGFLNPLIYSLDSTHFTDITRGENNCTEAVCRSSGYPAAVGYDAVTGRGTPIYSTWAATVASLPANYNSSTSSSSSSSSSSFSTSSSFNGTSTSTSTGFDSSTSTASTISLFAPLMFLLACSLF